MSVAHNANHHLDAALFKGADGVTPAGVRILYIRGEDGYEGPVLKVGNDGAARSVSKDDVITMAEFDPRLPGRQQVQWQSLLQVRARG